VVGTEIMPDKGYYRMLGLFGEERMLL